MPPTNLWAFPRALCEAFLDYEGHQTYLDVLLPAVPTLRDVLDELRAYRSLNHADAPYPVENGDLWQWYALSRLNDYLLRSFESAADFYQGVPPRWEWNGPVVTPSEYEDFYRALGFDLFLSKGDVATEGNTKFHPFFHEVIEVVEDADADGEAADAPVVEHTFWPGLRFGQMLFSRAGVRVRCRPGDLDKAAAETSWLYFTYSRLRRRTEDLSHGWGSNSQWGTAFRRDYGMDDAYHFNVDGEHPLGDEARYKASHSPIEWQMKREEDEERGIDALTMAERIELLTNRCFVRCQKDSTDRYPYDNTFILPKGLGKQPHRVA